MRTMRGLNDVQKRQYLKEWGEVQIEIFNEAKNLYGELTKETLPKYQKYAKKQKKLWREGKR